MGMSDTTGVIFKMTSFGESHDPSIGAIVEGCPRGLELSESDLQPQLDRRRPGQSSLTTPRNEKDVVTIVSGVEDGQTDGSAIELRIANQDKRPGDYAKFGNTPRPSHADYTWKTKYGVVAASGGGRASARETAMRVAAAGIAEKYLSKAHGIEIVAWVSSVGPIELGEVDLGSISRKDVDVNDVRCPAGEVAQEMIKLITDAAEAKDSVGGTITCVCRNVPAGLGEPVFGKMEAVLASAMLSIPATKGFEFGSGFAGTKMRGSEHNDMFVMKDGVLGTATNRSGGIQGGITNGEPIIMRIAFKPVASIGVNQRTVDYDGNPVDLLIEGRHDPCVLPRAVPVVEAMAALVLADMSLIAAKQE